MILLFIIGLIVLFYLIGYTGEEHITNDAPTKPVTPKFEKPKAYIPEVHKPEKVEPEVHKPKKTKAELIGESFELQIVTELKNLSKEYKIFHNILFKDGNIMVQIDFIIVSPYGVFVIEVKAHKGTIIGDINSQYWVQKLGNNNYKFYNPIKQNAAHINVFKYYLKNISFIPIVVFNDSTTLKVNCAIKMNELLDTINKYKKVVLTDKQVNYICAIIYRYKTTNPKDIEIHKNKVKQYG